MESFLDILFPKSCSICCRKGTYLCNRCKKLFKKTLPECYKCRRINCNYKTHNFCKREKDLDAVFVCWEYNSLTSDLLRKYKYGYVYDIDTALVEFATERIVESNYMELLENTLITNIPISSLRLRERGFNQTYSISKRISEVFELEFNSALIGRKHSIEHQAFKEKDERKHMEEEEFYISKPQDINNFSSITIVDDVITTGTTLENASYCLKKYYGESLIVNAICMFRGKPYYSESSDSEEGVGSS
jgi:ComF family protein